MPKNMLLLKLLTTITLKRVSTETDYDCFDRDRYVNDALLLKIAVKIEHTQNSVSDTTVCKAHLTSKVEYVFKGSGRINFCLNEIDTEFATIVDEEITHLKQGTKEVKNIESKYYRINGLRFGYSDIYKNKKPLILSL